MTSKTPNLMALKQLIKTEFNAMDLNRKCEVLEQISQAPQDKVLKAFSHSIV
jgi:hypothetical protein